MHITPSARTIGLKPTMCKLCDRFWDVLSAESDAWERQASNLDQLLAEEDDQTRAMIQRAATIGGTDPAAAVQLYREAADMGSTWSMGMVGWHYWTGTGVGADPRMALDYYHRAVSGGSWIDTIHYARVLAELGHDDRWERVLEDGVNAGFTPAYYWLARLRHERSRTSATRRHVRPLLEHAAENGHPGAKILLAQWMGLGKLRLRDLPAGWRLVLQAAVSFARRETAVPAS